MECLQCKSYTINPRFCSRSCAASYNNSLNPKVKFKCRLCNKYKKRSSKYGKLCIECSKPKQSSTEKWVNRQNYQNQKNKKLETARIKNIANKNYSKIKLIKESNPCNDCQNYFPAPCMDFDHRPEEVKLYNVASMTTYRWELIEAEISKCDLICANCHRLRTVNRASVTQ